MGFLQGGGLMAHLRPNRSGRQMKESYPLQARESAYLNTSSNSNSSSNNNCDNDGNMMILRVRTN